jgi:trimeric autotransporter adhesin
MPGLNFCIFFWALVSLTRSQTFLSAIAGNYSLSLQYNGEGLPATSSFLNNPFGVAVDAAQGNIYIADSFNNIVRRVDVATGTMRTIAGSFPLGGGYNGDGFKATNAKLSNPRAIAVDSSTGNVLIVDSYNNAIRMVNVTTGNISTVLGSPTLASGYFGNGVPATSAQLANPRGIAVDAYGNFYVADYGNHIVRKVNISTGIVTTVAGNVSRPGYSGDGGPAVLAQLYYPVGVALDLFGNLFITELGNNVVRKVNLASGVIVTVAGNVSLAVFSYRYNGDGLATMVKLNNPWGVTVDAFGNFYIADYSNNLIRMVNSTTGYLTTIAGNITLGQGFNNGGGAMLATLSQLNNPRSIAFDISRNLLYVADYGNNIIRRMNLTSQMISTVAGNNLGYGFNGDGIVATRSELYLPSGAVEDAWGNLYIADFGNNLIRKVNATTGLISTVAGNSSLGYGYSPDGVLATNAKIANPTSVALDVFGNLYFSDFNNNLVRKVNLNSGILTTVAGNLSLGQGWNGDNILATNAQLSSPRAIFVDRSGNVFISDTKNNIIRKVNPSTGIITTVAGNFALGIGYSGDGGPATSARLGNPRGFAVDTFGNIFFSDSANNVIRKVNATTGIITTIIGTSVYGYNGVGLALSIQLANPFSVALDSSGNIYVADYGNNLIRLLNVTTGLVSNVAGNFSLGLGYNGENILATNAQLANPFGVALDASDNLIITDTSNNLVRKTMNVASSISTTPTVSATSTPSSIATQTPLSTVSPLATSSPMPSTTPAASSTSSITSTPASTRTPSMSSSPSQGATPSSSLTSTPVSTPASQGLTAGQQGAIAGGVIGGVLVLIGVVVVAFMLGTTNKKKSNDHAGTPATVTLDEKVQQENPMREANAVRSEAAVV